jgi:hypothetical protein
VKKWWLLLMICAMLSGCGAEETFETVADEFLEVAAVPRQVMVVLPPEAAAPASESDAGTIYICDGYEIMLQTLTGGDLDATLRTVSGYGWEELTVVESRQGDYKRYDLVWACAGEEGERIGRGAVLDDGNYHYVLCVLSDADRVQEYEEVWSALFSSYSLG